MATKLKTAQVKPFRENMHAVQGGRCALSHYPIPIGDAVLDHCHTSGHVRGVLHRGVNSLLGKIENNFKRYGISYPMMIAMCKNLDAYLGRDHSGNPLYPTHKTADEKRERTNMLARKRRAAAKKEA